MGRLPWATPDVAYWADINDLVAGLYHYEESRRDLLEALFGPPEAPTDDSGTPPVPAAGPALAPLTPERFDALFPPTRPERSGVSA